jgi:hypothetical protein
MMTFSSALRWLAAIAFALTSAHASFAQTKEVAKITSAPQPGFESVFKDYQPLRDEKMVEWKATNDVVTRIGGWREYARQAQRAIPPQRQNEKAGAPLDAPATDPRAGQGSKP